MDTCDDGCPDRHYTKVSCFVIIKHPTEPKPDETHYKGKNLRGHQLLLCYLNVTEYEKSGRMGKMLLLRYRAKEANRSYFIKTVFFFTH